MNRESTALAPSAIERRFLDLMAGVRPDADPAALWDLLLGVAAAPVRLDRLEGVRLVAPDAAVAELEELRRIADAVARDFGRALTQPDTTPARLRALRAELGRRDLAGFVVPRNDEHHGEYVPLRAERLAWLTGFTGSAGVAVVLAERAAIFVDGRYTLQVRNQVDTDLFTPRHLTDAPVTDWLKDQLGPGQRLGFDPRLHAADGVKRLAAACAAVGAELVAVADNPLDAVWPDQPPPPLAPIVPHGMDLAGEASGEKRARLAETLAADGIAAAALTLPDSIAWLLNVRGGDVPRTPLPLSHVLLHADATVDWFVDHRKLVAGLADHLGAGVTVRPPGALGPALDRLGAAGARVGLDPASASVWLATRLTAAGGTVAPRPDPCQGPKAAKNPVEIAGARQAHRRDGAALSRFLCWLEGAAQAGAVDEAAAADRLQAYRAEDALIRDLSFDTISGAGPNGAIVHYRVTEASNRRLDPGSLYLVDSGAQYLDGTTDVTRTVAIGAPTAEMRDRFTRVLQGHIALARLRFPAGTTGGQIDALARAALWQAGLDYDHGTGHGVGSYLGVHEGPQRISKAGSTVALEPGMIVSNEPGYYKAGAFGIRIENLVVVREPEAVPAGERPMLRFETLTLAPIDRQLIAPDLLAGPERAWLDAYHARVLAEISPLVDAPTRAWLERATAPL